MGSTGVGEFFGRRVGENVSGAQYFIIKVGSNRPIYVRGAVDKNGNLVPGYAPEVVGDSGHYLYVGSDANQGGDGQGSFSQIPWLTAGNVNNDKSSSNNGTVPPFEFEIDAYRSRTHNGLLVSVSQPLAFPNTAQWTDENGVQIRANVYDVKWVVQPAFGTAVSYGVAGFSVTYTYSDGSPSIHQDLTRTVFLP
jgi:hypothetical protein